MAAPGAEGPTTANRVRRVLLPGTRTANLAWWGSVLAGWPLIVWSIVEVARAPRIELAPAFVMTAALAVLLELLPLVLGREHNPQGVVMSTSFAFALTVMWGPAPAVVIVAVGSLASDIRVRKALWKVAFNPAQYALTTFAAAAVVRLGPEHASLADPLRDFGVGDLGWMALAWVVWILVNFALVAAALTHDGSGFVENFTSDFQHETLLTFAVLAISPLVMVVAEAHWLLLPLLLIPMVLLYRTGLLALDRQHAAGHDALTGLPNRTTLSFELDRAFAAHHQRRGSFALMVVDLDDFKLINDTLGHQVGDALLVELAGRLRDAVRPGDCVARLGGDEFAMLVFDVDTAGALEVAERIRDAVSSPVVVDTIGLDVTLSLGIALCPEHAVDPTTLLRHADVAMYSAKAARQGVAIYHPDRDGNSTDQLALLGELRQALLGGDLQLHYQPKVAASDSTPVGFEALVRWEHPTRGPIAPDRFIPLAERSGVMPLLTARVIELAMMQSAAWRELGIRLPIAVNVSPSDLAGGTLVALIDGLLLRHEMDPALLMLEITERMATSELDDAERNLAHLHERGVRISLDDFGTGYSSLARLSSLAVDEIKIDRVFVEHMAQGAAAVSIVRTLVDLAHSRGLPAVAEGVEDHEQWRILAGLGCDGIQGWHVAPPMPAAEATAWIRSRLEYGPLPRLAPQGELPDPTGDDGRANRRAR